jgi:hypothetical protein
VIWAILPTLAWTVPMLCGLAVTLWAFREAHRDQVHQRRWAPGPVADRNLRAEAIRCLVMAAFSVVGLVALANQLGLLPAWLLPHYRWLFTGLLVLGGLGVVANSVLDARHRRRLLRLALRRQIEIVR